MPDINEPFERNNFCDNVDRNPKTGACMGTVVLSLCIFGMIYASKDQKSDRKDVEMQIGIMAIVSMLGLAFMWPCLKNVFVGLFKNREEISDRIEGVPASGQGLC